MKSKVSSVKLLVFWGIVLLICTFILSKRANAFEYNADSDVMGATSIRKSNIYDKHEVMESDKTKVLIAGVNRRRMEIVNKELDRQERLIALKRRAMAQESNPSTITRTQYCDEMGCDKWQTQ